MAEVLEGVNQGLNAIALGQQVGMRRRAEEQQNAATDLAKSAIDAWKSGDRQGYQNQLRELSAIDPKAAEDVNKTFSTIGWQNLVEAGYNLYAAAASPDVKAQNKLLDNSLNLLNAGPDHWMTQGLLRMRNMPEGEERTKEILGSVIMLKNLGVYPQEAFGGKETPKQKTGSYLVRDKDGNTKIVVGSYDPQTGGLEVVGSNLPPGYEMISDLGETAPEQTQRRLQEAGGKKQVEQAVEASQKFAEQYEKIQTNIGTIDEAINIIQKGIDENKYLGVGPIQKYFPKWTEASAQLQNVANRMGLNVVSSVTFGALSEGELKLAMTTAVPSNLNGPELLKWMKDKKASQEKLADYLRSASLFISSQRPDGTYNTVQDWMKKGRTRNSQPQEQTQPKEQAQEVVPSRTFSAAQTQNLPRFNSVEEGDASGEKYFIVGNTVYQGD